MAASSRRTGRVALRHVLREREGDRAAQPAEPDDDPHLDRDLVRVDVGDGREREDVERRATSTAAIAAAMKRGFQLWSRKSERPMYR